MSGKAASTAGAHSKSSRWKIGMDGSLAKGAGQRARLLREGVPMRGDRVDLREARLPSEL